MCNDVRQGNASLYRVLTTRHKSCLTRLADWGFLISTVYSALSANLAIKAQWEFTPIGAHYSIAKWDCWQLTGLGRIYVSAVVEASRSLGMSRSTLLTEMPWLYVLGIYLLAAAFPAIVRFLFVPFCQRADIRRATWDRSKQSIDEQGMDARS